jgi:S1-C subfamily serine protease
MSSLSNLSNSIAAIVEVAGKSIVAVNTNRQFAPSAIHWRQGIIVTSDESLKRHEDLSVTLEDGRQKSIDLLGRDPSTDIAVFRIDADDLPVAAMGDAQDLKVGNLVLALARTSQGDIGAAMGVASAVGGEWQSMLGGKIDRFIRPDINLYPGFSGGALVDAEGKVIGMNTTGKRGTALTIPTITIDRVVDRLLTKGKISRGYLGIGMQPVRLPDSSLQSLNLSSPYGVIIVNIEPNSAAESAGVLLGDILINLDDRPIADTRDILGILNDSSAVGKTVNTKLIRGGKLIDLPLTIGERS